MIFSAVRDWKMNIHCVVWILSVFFGLFVLLVPTQARDYHIRASDGEVYTVTLGETPDINNFSVRKSNGEILRGATEAERATTTELYFAAKLFWHILPFYSLNAPVEDLDVWVTDIAREAIIKLLIQQGADILLDGAVNGFLGTVQLLLGGNPVEIVEGWIPAAINDGIRNDAEQRLLIDAANLANSFAAAAVAHENMLRAFYLSFETRSVIISIDEINTAWESFYVVLQCKSLTTNLVHEYLQDPKSEISLETGSLGSIAVSLLPAGKRTTTIAERVVTTTDFIGDVIDVIETIDSINYTQEHIEKLQRVRETAGADIRQQVLSDISEKKRELRGTLDQVGYFQPTIAAQLEDMRLLENDLSLSLDVRDYFSPNSGESLTYIGHSNDLNVAAVRAERPGSSVIIITPKGVGTTSVIVELKNLRGLRVTQSFSVTVNEPSPEQDGTIPNENETEVIPLPNHPPQVYRQIDPINFRGGGSPKWRNLSSYFSDPDDNTLTYTATSSNSLIAAVSISDNSVEITPVSVGTATVTVMAHDPGGLTATQSFRVTVQAEQAKSETIPSLPVCDRTLQVREEIMKRTRDNNCANVTEDELESIRRLSLLEEDITILKQGDFDELRGLEELVLKGNFLETLPKDVFWYLGNLKELSLRNNQFTILVEDTFEHLDSLTDLSLRGNQLTTLQQGAFDDLHTLVELDLSDNQLTTLPARVFEELFNLNELILENNRIAILSKDVFLGLSNLKDLELDENPLHTIEAGAFNGLSSLTKLDFNNYPLHTIEAGAFNGLSSLTKLELGSNELRTLSRDVFLGLSSLKDLELGENPLHTIEIGAFNGLSSLRYLDLEDAQLSTLSRDVFLGLSSLDDLDLKGNALKTVEVGAFNGLSSLTTLDLGENQLTMLRAGTFSGLSNLTRLSLDENRFDILPADIFSGLSKLNHLNLSENKLNTLPAGVFTGLSDLTYLNLRDNPGAPFTLVLELARTDNVNHAASGPATVKVKLVEGAPFEMNVSLSVEGGTLSANTATIARGSTESEAITVTQSEIGPTTVNLGSAPTIPSGYSGIQMAIGSSLVLFTGDKGPFLENGQGVKHSQIREDINRDGMVNIQDIVIVAASFGATGENPADLNGDGQVNIQDLVLVANALGNTAAAPAAHSQVLDMLTAADLKQWLTQAQQLNLTDATSQRGILFLENLLATLTPKETSLLPNYPNPFNPETWIPYQLAEPADVTLTIYAVDGSVVRTLALGHQSIGVYQNRSLAAYWDGKNELGEPVASGLYFYTLTAGDFSATRKMLIQK